MATDNRSVQKAEISLPEEITEQILYRLPVKSVLRFKSVSKLWLSLISNPSFTKLHSTLGPRTTSLFFTISDSFTDTRYLFSVANDSGSVANLIKLYNTPYEAAGRAQHLNGLVFFTHQFRSFSKPFAYVINPTTRKFFKLPDPVPFPNDNVEVRYIFGFHELRNEHKVLYVDVGLIKLTTMEIMIFSFLNYSWRKINVDLPVGMSAMRWEKWFYRSGVGVCVNSTIHLMLHAPFEILAFDLTTETFSIINIPPEAVPETASSYPHVQFVTLNGLLGVACYGFWNEEERNKVHIWILQHYEKRVWVRETVTFPHTSDIHHGYLGRCYPFDSINMDEIIFSPRILSEDSISVPIYNLKTRCFKSIRFTLGHRFLCPESVDVEEIKCYVESLSPLQN